jgi:hypothetical protein
LIAAEVKLNVAVLDRSRGVLAAMVNHCLAVLYKPQKHYVAQLAEIPSY